MVRAPCCEKMGLKKGPWTHEEDHLLISYIQKHGHGNWRALPKQAGLLRCGKSCRLRWINYLRPDIKRGNFTIEEEETIMKLHEIMGNRWSAIAAELPGRTDNEIKNVWHTHLKKRLQKTNQPTDTKTKSRGSNKSKPKPSIKRSDSNTSTVTTSSSDISSSLLTVGETHDDDKNMSDIHMPIKSEQEDIDIDSLEFLPEIDESFWSEAAMDDNYSSSTTNNDQFQAHQYPLEFESIESVQQSHGYNNSSKFDDEMDFWYDIFLKTGDSIELPPF